MNFFKKLAKVLLFLFVTGFSVSAAESPPLPLHGIEGYGGVAITYTAYLTNPSKEHIFGKPSIGSGFVVTNEGDSLIVATITETIGERLELGYAFDSLHLSGIRHEIREKTGIKIGDNDVIKLHNFNVRIALIREGEFGIKYMPAITAGVHYKYNDTINDIGDDLSGTLNNIGIKDNDGVEYTLYASKMITFLPRPFLINLGLRSTKAAHAGFLGFTKHRRIRFEGNIVTFLTNNFALGAEYRQKVSTYKEIPGLVREEGDWWSFVFAYIFNSHLTMSGGYFSLGDILNHEQDQAFGIKLKWEF